MDHEALRRAQQGVPLADMAGQARRSARAAAAIEAETLGRRADTARGPATGLLLTRGAFSLAERRRLLDGLETVIGGVYTHLPLKRARYGFDPVQRLRIVRNQMATLDDSQFHLEIVRITTELRDAHTRYAGPASLRSKVATLPFLVEWWGGRDDAIYMVSKVGPGLDAEFRRGVVLEYWNGVPIDVAVARHGDSEVGGRPDSRRAWAVQSLTFRSLRYAPPPDEHWVVVGYRATDDAGEPTGPAREIRIPWRVIDPRDMGRVLGPDAAVAGRERTRVAVDPAAADIRRAKMLMFSPGALVGEQAEIDRGDGRSTTSSASTIVPTELTDTLRVMTVDGPGGPYGHLRIFGFDTDPDRFVAELVRLIPLLPEAGLIVDVRGNPGGYILAAELALQLFTPRTVQPTRFSVLATPFTRDLADSEALADELGPWKPSLDAAVHNGELYSQPLPITDPAACNAIGQRYGGPVVLVGDSTTYSSGDLFSAGFVDNAIGPFLCVGDATGAGGANVWEYADLRHFADLPELPDGVGLTFSFRRATRAGPSEGLPIEDVGVAGIPYAMTRRDLLEGNRDLLDRCIALLGTQTASRMGYTVDGANRTIDVRTQGLTHVDAFVDGHPIGSTTLQGDAAAQFAYPDGARELQLVGFSGDAVLQRRRIALG